MKVVIYLIIVITTSIASFYIGSTYQALEHANISEDIIARDFHISERHADIPSCSDIKAAKEAVSLTKNGNDYVIWAYDEQERLVIKTIVTSDMNTIYTETPLECSKL